MEMEKNTHEYSGDSERTEDGEMDPSTASAFSESTVFKYCLAGFGDRASILKDVASTLTEEALSQFAHDVALYTGCSHHLRQITSSKPLINDGTRLWKTISRKTSSVMWEDFAPHIQNHLAKIARSGCRVLSKHDLETLRVIAGCGEEMREENFERMWCWLYPVAMTLSIEVINEAWRCEFPRWIEGLVTKEEAEESLEGEAAGTFILRFASSRRWPHPDAGSIVISYVGRDLAIHHRLLSLDFIASCSGSKSLGQILMEDPALSRLGRFIRS